MAVESRAIAATLAAAPGLFDREGPGSHEVWRQPGTGRKVTLPRHTRDFAEGTLRAVLRQAGIAVDDFLDAR